MAKGEGAELNSLILGREQPPLLKEMKNKCFSKRWSSPHPLPEKDKETPRPEVAHDYRELLLLNDFNEAVFDQLRKGVRGGDLTVREALRRMFCSTKYSLDDLHKALKRFDALSKRIFSANMDSQHSEGLSVDIVHIAQALAKLLSCLIGICERHNEQEPILSKGTPKTVLMPMQFISERDVMCGEIESCDRQSLLDLVIEPWYCIVMKKVSASNDRLLEDVRAGQEENIGFTRFLSARYRPRYKYY